MSKDNVELIPETYLPLTDKQRFAIKVIGTAAGFLATVLAERGYTALVKRSAKSNDESDNE